MIFGNLIGVEIFFLIAGGAIALFAVYAGAWSLRCFLLQTARDVLQFAYSARQMQIDHERARGELALQLEKNDLMVEEARDRLRANRQKLLSSEVKE